jgi:hypothetical protein
MQCHAKQAANQGRNIALVLLAGLALRVGIALVALAVALPDPQFREPDSDGYLRLAANWLRTGRYAVGAEPEILWPPGYPLTLLPGIALGRVDLVTIGFQSLLACATIWLTYRTALAIFNDRTAALGAAWLLACDPQSSLYTNKLLSETAFTTMISLAVYLLVHYLASPDWRKVSAAAVCLAAAAYLRPIAYYLPIWLGASLLAIIWRRPDRRRLAWQALAMAAVGMALLVPWQVRNWFQAGYGGFAAVSDKNLYYYEALPIGVPAERREQARRDAGEIDLAAYLRQHPEQTAWSAADRYRFLRDDGIRTIRAHPLAWARVHFAGVWNTLTDPGRNAWLAFFRLETRAPAQRPPSPSFWQRLTAAASQRPAVLAIHVLLTAIITTYLGLAAIGILHSPSNPKAMLLLGVVVYLLVLSGGDAGYHRFRLPITPAICLFAAYGYCSITAWHRLREQSSTGTP